VISPLSYAYIPQAALAALLVGRDLEQLCGFLELHVLGRCFVCHGNVLSRVVIPNRGSAVPWGTAEHFLGVPRDVETIKK
jgi:hypothetical protein